MPDGERCMRITSGEMSGTDAEEYCQEQGEEGHLVRISSDEENESVAELVWDELGEVPEPEVWIGLNDLSDEGSHIWYDGSGSEYRNWGPGQPNNSGESDCVTLSLIDEDGWDNMWNDEQCPRSDLHGVCQLPTGS
jgi:hypothetical protein